MLVSPQRTHCSTPLFQSSPAFSTYRPAVILPVRPSLSFSCSLSLPQALGSHIKNLRFYAVIWQFGGLICSHNVCISLIDSQGLGNNLGDYQKLTQTLNDKYGVPTVVAKVSRIDWLRNAAGLVDPNYWRGTLRPRPVLDW